MLARREKMKKTGPTVGPLADAILPTGQILIDNGMLVMWRARNRGPGFVGRYLEAPMLRRSAPVALAIIGLALLTAMPAAAAGNCADLIFSESTNPQYSCTISDSSGGNSSVQIHFAPSNDLAMPNEHFLMTVGDPLNVQYRCQCKTSGSTTRPNFFESKTFICLYSDSVTTFLGSIEGQVAAKGAKLTKFTLASTLAVPRFEFAAIGSCVKN